jgi:hypothetical protein
MLVRLVGFARKNRPHEAWLPRARANCATEDPDGLGSTQRSRLTEGTPPPHKSAYGKANHTAAKRGAMAPPAPWAGAMKALTAFVSRTAAP